MSKEECDACRPLIKNVMRVVYGFTNEGKAADTFGGRDFTSPEALEALEAMNHHNLVHHFEFALEVAMLSYKDIYSEDTVAGMLRDHKARLVAKRGE